MQVLTDKYIKALKPQPKRYDVRDAALPGLVLRVNADGTKTWTVVVSKNGKRRRVVLGRYPEIRLADARKRASERKTAGHRLSGTVETVFANYLDEIRHDHRAWKSVEGVARLYMLPLIGSRKIETITASDGVELLEYVQRKSSRDRAAKTLAYLRPFFRWAAGKTYIPTNPWAVVVAPGNTSEARERVLTDDELAAVWGYAKSDTYPFGPYLQLLILTAQRRAEVAGMMWSEIDVERRLWTIPKGRHKQKRGHEVPLSNACIDIISALPCHCDFVFSTTRRSPISGFGKLKARLDRDTGIESWRLHDIRRTAATRMAELEVPRFILARVLGHADTSITATYDRATYRAEKLAALDKWSKFVLDLGGNQ